MPGPLREFAHTLSPNKSGEVQVHDLDAYMVLSCECGSPRPLLVHGFRNRAICESCAAVYIIAEMSYLVDETTGQATCRAKAAKLTQAPQIHRPGPGLTGGRVS